ncbi:hypothetical protein MRB53_038599 [Persea americana]|nr:hypothetical protein MRB53_038599 [Persea americana]
MSSRRCTAQRHDDQLGLKTVRGSSNDSGDARAARRHRLVSKADHDFFRSMESPVLLLSLARLPARHHRAAEAYESGWLRWMVIGAATATLFVGVGFGNAFGVYQEYYENVLFPDIPPSKLVVIGSVASSLY